MNDKFESFGRGKGNFEPAYGDCPGGHRSKLVHHNTINQRDPTLRAFSQARHPNGIPANAVNNMRRIQERKNLTDK